MMRFQVRVGYALELVLVLAAGMVWRAVVVRSDPGLAGLLREGRSRQGRFQFVAGPVPGGRLLGGGLGLLVESLRGSPATWGLGRRIWSVAVLDVPLLRCRPLCDPNGGNLEDTPGALHRKGAAVAWVRNSSFTTFYPSAGWALAAVLVTSWFSGEPRCGHLDAREWGGRILLGLIVMEAIAFRFLGIIS